MPKQKNLQEILFSPHPSSDGKKKVLAFFSA
jgi:hypothetical protein